jgi:hypothetical protein
MFESPFVRLNNSIRFIVPFNSLAVLRQLIYSKYIFFSLTDDLSVRDEHNEIWISDSSRTKFEYFTIINHFLRNNVVIILMLILSQIAISQHLSWQNYTTENGLPGNEVYNVIQDEQGFLWFSTNQGICRFNGYEFTRPVDTSAQRGSEAFVMTADPA